MAEKGDGEGASGKPQPEAMSEDDRSPEAAEDSVTLSFLDKLKCMMYSKVERDAFLIEKLEKEEKKKAKKASGEAEKETKKKKPTLLGKLKSVFTTPEEQHEFLQRQVEEVADRQQKSQSADEAAGAVSKD